MQQQPAHFAYRPALDGLRAVAVSSVFAYHLGYGWLGGGFLGVDTFFVLSGYLITSLLLVEWASTGTIDFAAFWVRRARRLLPALLLVLVAVAIYAAVAVPSDELDRLRGDGLATLFYSANWRLIWSGQSYFDLFTAASPFRHAWSLAIEEQFYLVWPLVTFACLRIARGKRWALTGVCVVGSGVSMLAMAALYDEGDPSRAYYGTDARAHALLIGVLLAILLAQWKPERGKARMFSKVAGWAGAAYMVFAFIWIGDTDPWMYRGGLAVFAVAVAAVITSIVQRWRYPVRTALSVAPVVWIGKISYGLYLWHWPVIIVMTPARIGIDGTPLNLLRVAVTLAISTASFYLIEMPIRRGVLKRRMAIILTPAAFAVAGLAVVVGTVGATPPPEFAQEGTVITAGGGDPSTDTSIPTADTVPVPGAPQRVLLVGDSVAASLLPGLEAVVNENGMAFGAAALPGCGVAGGVTTDDNGEPFEWSEQCDANIASTHERVLMENNPDVVVWLSTWETADRIVDGEHVEFGTAEGDRVLTEKIDEAVVRLSSGGARVVFLTVAPHAEPNENDLGDTNDGDEKLARLNGLLEDYAAAHPETTSVIDVVEILCPDGDPPCPAEIDGVRPRPRDGRHFEGDGPRWFAERILPQLTTASAPTA